MNLGAVYSDTGDPRNFPAAEAALKKSLALGPSYPAYANLGFLYSLTERWADAASMTEKALQMNDKDYQVWRNLGEDYSWAQMPEKAAFARRKELELLEATVLLRPQDAELVSEMAALYAESGLAEKAMTAIQKALALAPENLKVLSNAAETSEALGNRAEAIRYSEQCLNKGCALDDLKRTFALQNVVKDVDFRAPVKK